PIASSCSTGAAFAIDGRTSVPRRIPATQRPISAQLATGRPVPRFSACCQRSAAAVARTPVTTTVTLLTPVHVLALAVVVRGAPLRPERNPSRSRYAATVAPPGSG